LSASPCKRRNEDAILLAVLAAHAPVTEVGPNDDFRLKVIEHDAVFKVRS
jgi:hypothetical protein